MFIQNTTPFRKLIWLKKVLGGNNTVEKTVSGSVIHVTDALAKAVKSLTVSIGSTGFTGVNVWVDAEHDTTAEPTVSVTFPLLSKNLANFIDGYQINSYGNIQANNNRSATVDPITIESGTSYIFSCDNDCLAIYAVWNGETLVRREAGIASGSTLNTSDGDRFYVCIYKSNYTTSVETDKPMVRKSTESSEYEPYKGNTVYDGTFNVTTGVLTVIDGEESKTYQLTPTEIQLLSGENYVWADTGDCELTYLAPA